MSDRELIKQEIERRLMFFSNECDETRILSELIQFIDSLPEEHNEDLEEAALKYRWEHPFCDGYTAYSFKAGAEWQKQQMMKDAVEGKVQCGYGDGNKLSIKAMLPQDSDLKYADKVKVLILKTE